MLLVPPERERYQLTTAERPKVVVMLTKLLAAGPLPGGAMLVVLDSCKISRMAVTAIWKWAIMLPELLCKKTMIEMLLITKH